MADEVVRVLTELSAVYQEAAKKSRPIMYSARFFADLAQVAAARGKLDGASERGGTDGGTDGGQQVCAASDPGYSDLFISIPSCAVLGPARGRGRSGTTQLGGSTTGFRRVVSAAVVVARSTPADDCLCPQVAGTFPAQYRRFRLVRIPTRGSSTVTR